MTRLIEKQSGPVVDVGTVHAGRNSAVAARVRVKPDRELFVKGLPLDHKWVWTQQREADVAPYVSGLAPGLLWHVEADGWSLLGFEFVDGVHADYSPGSPDVVAVLSTMTRLAEVPAPNLDLKTMPHRLRAYADDPDELEWFAGDSLLHTEWNPENVLVTGRGAAVLVDWGWASLGAAWIDPALWLMWLVADGHSCAQAERVVSSHPAWASAPPTGLDALARVQRRLWDSIAQDSADGWAWPMRRSARAWERYREVLR